MSATLYCNPLPLPQLPRGRYSGQPTAFEQQFDLPDAFCIFFGKDRPDFRESGDVEVLHYQPDGCWYLFGSSRAGDSVYRSRDFLTWEHFQISLTAGNGYAPAVTQRSGKVYLSFSLSPLYEADHPLGPYHSLGYLCDQRGAKLKAWLDPALFTDDDQRMYAYWGYGPADGGLFGAEIESLYPPVIKGEPTFLIDFNREHLWERFGEANEDPDFSSLEGASMFKHEGRYYLLYSANGAGFRNYAEGCYIGSSPLGPFEYARSSPFARQSTGIVNSCAHGGFVRGPNNQVWYFYSTCIRQRHEYERRIGRDRVFFNAAHEPQVCISASPRHLDGSDAGLLPVSVNKRVDSSSHEAWNIDRYAIDDCTHTWWQPAFNDPQPWLTLELRREFALRAIRILWSEVNLDYERGILPEPVKYRLDFYRRGESEPSRTLDFSDQQEDLVVDFRTFAEIPAQRVRLTILQGDDLVRHGLTQITCFGKPYYPPAEPKAPGHVSR